MEILSIQIQIGSTLSHLELIFRSLQMQLLVENQRLVECKFTELKSKLEELEIQKCIHIEQHKWTALKEIPRVEALIFGAWNSLPECYTVRGKKFAYRLLTIFRIDIFVRSSVL
ncbi:hypothetical protein AVEN_205132-1 [Araneus ventricosus]|uniref:Uncharacterized protein n=1 Tax=Araneus ventricosus TaxID=182803 RepID=A0A4Y2IQG1_ARAVE|nr:hypothetical protein AVEN_205132-1 [Araneus ventricosus]